MVGGGETLHPVRSPAYLASFTIDGQDDPRLEAVRLEIGELDPAVLGLDESLGDGQPEAAATTLAGVEGLANTLDLAHRDAVAPIPHDQSHRQLAFAGVQLDHPPIGGQCPDRLHRVEHEIQQNLSQLPLITANRDVRKPGQDPQVDRDIAVKVRFLGARAPSVQSTAGWSPTTPGTTNDK